MQEITKEFLESKGFFSNHPERALGKYHLNNPKDCDYEYHITATQEYKPSTNKLCWNIDCWRSEEGISISRRSSVHYITDVDDLKKCIDLCDIDVNI